MKRTIVQLGTLMAVCLALTLAACGDDGYGGDYDEQLQPVCESIVAAGCSMSPESVASCQSSFGKGMPYCEPELLTLIDCVGDSSTSSCHQSGMPMVDGCESETGNAYLCVTSVH